MTFECNFSLLVKDISNSFSNLKLFLTISRWNVSSLLSKRSRTKRTKFWPRVLVFCILDERKMGQEQRDGRKGVGEGKKGTLARKPLDFEKAVRPRTGLLIGAAWSS